MIKNFIQKINTDTASALQYHQLWRFTCAVLIGVLMVKAGWPKEKVAIYELLFFTAHLLSFAWSTGINNALLAIYPSLTEEKKKVLFFNATFLMFLLSILMTAVFWIFKFPILNLLTGDEYLPYTNWIAVYLLFSPSSVLIQSIYLLRERPDLITKYTNTIFIVQLIIVLIAILGFGTVQALVIGIAIWSVIKFVWLVVVLNKYAKRRIDYDVFVNFTWFSIPLILQFVLGNGMEYIDGVIFNHYFDATDFSVFRYGSRELPITIILVISLSSAMLPLAVQYFEDTLGKIKKRTEQLMHFLFPLSIILILTSPYIYTFVYSDAYIKSAQLFNIYLLMLITRILLPQVIIYAKKRNGALVYMTIVEILINITLSIYWAQTIGLVGIAYATIVANICHTLMMIIYNKVRLGVSASSYIPLKTYSIYVSLLLLSFLISSQIYVYG